MECSGLTAAIGFLNAAGRTEIQPASRLGVPCHVLARPAAVALAKAACLLPACPRAVIPSEVAAATESRACPEPVEGDLAVAVLT